LEIEMNIKQLIAAVAILTAAGTALAQSAEYVTPDAGFISTMTRAEAVAELAKAKADGTYQVASTEYQGRFAVSAHNAGTQREVAAISGKTRAEVLAELKQAEANGSYVTGGEEFPGQLRTVALNPGGRASPIEVSQNSTLFGVNGD